MPMSEAFCWKSFDTLTNVELYALLRLRSEVFVVEQNCVFLDLDDYDQMSEHLLMQDAAGALIGTARLLPPGVKYPECSIGRVVNPLALRGTGAGKRLMTEAVHRARARFPGTPILIWAQQRLQGFYEQFGFVCCAEPEYEDGILHVKMRLAQ